MVKSFKEFWRSYWELCKTSQAWLKEHWVGYTILAGVTTAIGVLLVYIPDWISKKKRQKELINELRKETEQMESEKV